MNAGGGMEMKSDRMAAAVIIGILAGAVIAGFFETAARSVCVTKPEKIEFSCIEFWANRYQTIAAAAMSIVVAIFVVRPVFAQLKEMTKQSSKGAKEIAEIFAAAIDDEITALQKIRNSAEFCKLTLHDFDMLAENVEPTLREDVRREVDAIRVDVVSIKQNHRRQIADITINSMRKDYLNSLDKFIFAANDYSVQMTIYGRSKSRVRAVTAHNVAKVGKNEFGQVVEFSDRLVAILENLSVDKWAQVRLLERKAQGIDT